MIRERAFLQVLAGMLYCLLLVGCDSTLRDQIELYVSIKNGGIIYVDGTSGNDANPGTRERPKASIQNAIELAAALMDEGQVWVAEGTYVIQKTLVVREGISIFGEYEVPGWTRNRQLQPTTIIQGDGIDTVIKPERGVTTATVIDGFTIIAASEDTVTCIWCDRASPTIRFTMLDSVAGSEDTIGIFNQYSEPFILSNTINAGQGSMKARGILNQGASPRIWNNLIYGLGDNSTFIAISNNDNSDAVIQNNTIRAGTTSGGIGIYCSQSNCVIENNILFTDGVGCGIYEVDSSALPVRVRNNDLYACAPVYQYDGGSCTTVAQMESYLFDAPNNIVAVDNTSDNPDFENQSGLDWHLKATSSIKDAGLDLSVYFTHDREDVPRTFAWSIGAYEQD